MPRIHMTQDCQIKMKKLQAELTAGRIKIEVDPSEITNHLHNDLWAIGSTNDLQKVIEFRNPDTKIFHHLVLEADGSFQLLRLCEKTNKAIPLDMEEHNKKMKKLAGSAVTQSSEIQ